MNRYPATVAAMTAAITEIRGPAGAGVIVAAGLGTPVKPNTAREAQGATVIWLGPKRWLVLNPPRPIDAAREPNALAVDVSDMFAGRALRGAGAGDLLAQGTPLDLDALAPDAATMSDLFMVPAIIRKAPDGYDIWIDRALAQYLDECLRIANGG